MMKIITVKEAKEFRTQAMDLKVLLDDALINFFLVYGLTAIDKITLRVSGNYSDLVLKTFEKAYTKNGWLNVKFYNSTGQDDKEFAYLSMNW